MGLDIHPKKPLSVLGLLVINVIAVDNLRNLTAGAEFGLALIFFYGLAALLFFIPTILVTAELATGWPTTGGVYIWVREAFGPRLGFLTIWLQWIYNVIWYPTIFAFISGMIAYLINPSLIQNKIFIVSLLLSTYWSVTLLNYLGIKVISLFSLIGAVLGTLLPMMLISLLGIIWLYLGKPTEIHFTFKALIPNEMSLHNLAFLTNILFGLMGMEMSAVHAGDVKNPARDYPRALFYSMIIILSTLILSSLAVTLVVPLSKLNLVSGLIDAFAVFFTPFHLQWVTSVVVACIIIGSLSSASAWLIGPARGLFVASKDNALPSLFEKVNKKQMPSGILFVQGIIVTFLSLLFFIMPTISSAYWILSNLTAQLALLFYILMFAAAIRLRYKYPNIPRPFRIPGYNVGIWVICSVGILTCMTAIVVGFLPPNQVVIGSIFQYELILVLGMTLFCAIPFIYLKTQCRRKTEV